MTKRENAKAWLFSLAYTAYAGGVVAGAIAVVGANVGAAIVGFVLALAPLVAWTFWEAE